ncbi:formylglycine-generating enzyme family protein [Flavobacteriaceae bacterium F89]|uniref:Formylglycine-generating enzyme family protein n=1 Tax=Cerina litoralis TaxID=2874477 RepID=A0AAE3JRE5_9FLAO|nr:SUMF1/EgtB/PvdO family nonheme iron enzyme [Cerina litoralis]MCG2461248.1 formylglycine-generating enzyme family protein [Cerina litoralis]
MRYFSWLIGLVAINYFLIGGKACSESESSDFGRYSEKIPGSNIAIDMVPINGGIFLMGSPSNEKGRNPDEGPQKEVKVNPFWMGAYEITWDQYSRFLDEKAGNIKSREVALKDGSKIMIDGVSTATPMYIDMSFGMGRQGFPAINMTQYAAMMYARWLYTETGHFYRLPTEAEWEYACRAGSKTAFYYGNDIGELNKFAWFDGNSGGGYKKVGTKAPNAFGLYDMHGNVSEWTADQYCPDYFKKLNGNPTNSPYFKPTTLYPRSVRGGSWMDDGLDLRSAKRQGSSSAWKMRDPQMPKSIWWLTDAPFVGFRLVRPKETPTKDEIEKYWIQVMDDF